MKITTIESFMRDEKFAVIRVRTDDGHEGWGQTSAYLADVTVAMLHSLVAQQFVGVDPWDWPAAVERFTRKNQKFYGSVLWRAVSGIDTAVHDLLGKAVGRPVYALLGGAVRTEIPVYGSSMRRSISAEEEVSRFESLRDSHGFRAFKLRVAEEMGRDTDPWLGRSHDIVALARERLGSDVVLHADANGGYSPAEAIRMGRHLEAHGFGHFEEPCPWNELESIAEVSRVLDIPVAGGEQDNVLEQVHRMVVNRVVDIIQPDIGYIGGMTRAVKVTQMAEAAGIVATPHCANHTMLKLFNLHLAASQPAVSGFQEWSIESDSWCRDLFSPMPQVVNGTVTVSDAPGWGIEVSEDYLRSAQRNVTQ